MYKDLTDSQLLITLRQSSNQAKTEILLIFYERYKHLVLKVCYHYLADYDQANEWASRGHQIRSKSSALRANANTIWYCEATKSGG